jgi:hypothetical protein
MAKKIQPIKPTPKTDSIPETKRSQITYKKDEPVTSPYAAFGEAEKTIQELTRMLAELPGSRHFGVGGKQKLTEKEKMLKAELAAARVRVERLLKIIERH